MSAGLPPAMILAAGYGTRLRPLTDELPKPLCPIGDRPQIDHVLSQLARAGVPRAVVNAHHLADRFDEAWRTSQALPVDVVVEASILGTAGGVANAATRLGPGDVLLWNADILADVDALAVVEAHRTSGALATLVVKKKAGGRIGLGSDGAVIRLRDRSFGDEVEAADYLGIAVLGPALRARLPAEGCLVGDGFIPALAADLPLRAWAFEGTYRDTGSIDEYLQANVAWLAGREAWVAESAIVSAGITLRSAVVGAGARVEGSGALERCVVWPGAVATAPLRGAVVTPRGVVRAGAS